jgi:hypothetical protein
MTVLSMSKQEFNRLDVLLRVQSGRLRVVDARALMGLHRRQVFRLLRGLKHDGPPSLLSKRRGNRAITVYRLRFARWLYRSCASGMLILAQPSQPRSWQSIMDARFRMRRCVAG